ncbi:MAG TPA: efflux RND transporter periplasmic adaptor subunit [Xanthobacteraceae bacterium]|jgi:HlyD family secretion protein|nr:efflux RND transporter periplasmic adaptor subunit [Xanthobacteraceae bacterium]
MNTIAKLAAAALLFAVAACDQRPQTFQGWVEANLIFVAPDESGRIEQLYVREGAPVEKGTPLFTIDEQLQRAELNLNTAQLTMAQQTYDRALKLRQSATGTQRDLDVAESDLHVTQARVNASQTKLDRRKMTSPVAGTIQQIYFRPGEMVTAGRPIVSILPPGNLKLRFFIPEAMLPRIAYGDSITVNCDNCDGGLTAKISFISKSAEFTPPVIYSLEERNKLVFLVEALPEQPEKFRLGQPIDVSLTTSEAKK